MADHSSPNHQTIAVSNSGQISVELMPQNGSANDVNNPARERPGSHVEKPDEWKPNVVLAFIGKTRWK